MADSGGRAQNPYEEPSKILKKSDPADIAERTGIPYENDEFRMALMRWNLYISFPDLSFRIPRFLDTFVIKLLALLYMANATAVQQANQWVPYRELKDGLFYNKSFTDTVEDRVCRRFGDDLEAMKAACGELGGREVDQGDLGMVVQTFNRLPLLFILWRGDEEFDPNARILFDSSATNYLNAFELRMLCGEIVARLIRIADGGMHLPLPE
jgi:Domain of unknown function (DUF3786)